MHTRSGSSIPFPPPKHNLPEDDSTFAPPALSAYSIALLSNRAQGRVPPVSGLYGVELKENTALRNSLKNKLSVHFNDRATSPRPAPPADALATESSASPGTGNNYSSATTVSNVSNGSSASTVLSFGNMPQVGNASSTSHPFSDSNNNTASDSDNPTSEQKHKEEDEAIATDGISTSHKSLPMSLGSKSNSTKLSVLNHEDMDGVYRSARFSSPRTTPVGKPSSEKDLLHASLPSNLSTKSFSSSLSISSARPLSSSIPAGKSRLSRRFRSLGPPKRASEMILEQQAAQESKTKNEASSLSGDIFSVPSHENGLDDKTLRNKVSNRTISSESDFFKKLEKLSTSPVYDNISTKSSNPLKRPSSSDNNFDVHSDKSAEHHVNKRIDIETLNNSAERRPLQDILPTVVNQSRILDDFRKPKTPRSRTSLESSKPKDLSTRLQDATPALSKREISHNQGAEDSRRRKVIRVNSTDYEKLELLGRGGTSKVYKVRSTDQKKVFAIKKVTFDHFDEACVKGFKGEIDLLKKLKNEQRVVSLIDHATSEGSIFLVMECGDLDLAHVLSNRLAAGAPLDLNFVRFHAAEVFRCIQAVHNAGIVHSDLKPANFLFVGGILKIIDFGIANAVPDHTSNIYRHSQIGTPNYMAPEALVEVNNTLSFSSKTASTTWKVGRPSDIWSCGCIIYQMIYGRPPYGMYSGQQRIMAIMNPMIQIQYPNKGVGDVFVPQSVVILMKKCLERNPHDRWTVEQSLDSDFLRPRAVSQSFLKDLVYSAVNFGYNQKDSPRIDDDIYDKLVATVVKQIEELNFA